MSIVKIDCLKDSMDYHKWTFFDGVDEHTIICRHAEKYFEKIVRIATSRDTPVADKEEAAKHQVNRNVSREVNIDHSGLDFFEDDGYLRIVGWTDEEVLFDFQCHTEEFIHDFAKLVDDHFQNIGILYYGRSSVSIVPLNYGAKEYDRFSQDDWITSMIDLCDIVLLKACVLGGYDIDEMIGGIDVDLSRDVKILMTPIA